MVQHVTGTSECCTSLVPARACQQWAQALIKGPMGWLRPTALAPTEQTTCPQKYNVQPTLLKQCNHMLACHTGCIR